MKEKAVKGNVEMAELVQNFAGRCMVCYGTQISPKAELCVFKWVNTYKTCVHDFM